MTTSERTSRVPTVGRSPSAGRSVNPPLKATPTGANLQIVAKRMPSECKLPVSRRRILRGIAAAAVWGLWMHPQHVVEAASNLPVVAAAASLRFVLPEIARKFTEKTGNVVRLSFASSGSLARQIRQGAPFELFLSADEDFIWDLINSGLTLDEGLVYAIGGLAIFASHISPVAIDPALAGLKAALRNGQLQRFAIANPELAPYGRAAREALMHQNLWEACRGRLVYGENVSQAAQFAASGSCEAALIALSLARSPGIAAKGRSNAIPNTWHRPLRQRMVLLPSAGTTARALFEFLQGATARSIFSRQGFAAPETATR